MFWIVAFGLCLAGAFIQSLLSASLSTTAISEIGLVWLVAGFYGIATLIAGTQHIVNPDRIAKDIGWMTGSGFQLELGWAELGLGLAGVLSIWFRGAYFMGPGIAGSALYLGSALVHGLDMTKYKNFNPRNTGSVFYIHILVPVLVCALLVLHAPWK